MKAVLAHARLLLDIVSMEIFVSILGHDGERLLSWPSIMTGFDPQDR